jgi:D-alanyl-lipoteichoic acid acyltransferase DltB (MBOAT superfamily)
MSLVIAAANAWAALWRLGGGTGIDVMGRPLTAPTVADFWRRWNRPAQSFFREYVFDYVGGRRRMRLAIMATFAVSALGHEYIFSIAAGRVQGYQTAFFLIHGLAAVATLRVRPRGWHRVPWMIATLAFVIVTSVLFGVSLNEIVPVYADRK